jgi:hypothetical protein
MVLTCAFTAPGGTRTGTRPTPEQRSTTTGSATMAAGMVFALVWSPKHRASSLRIGGPQAAAGHRQWWVLGEQSAP